MKKRKKKPNECHECLRGHELIAEYMGGEADTEPTRELLLHAQLQALPARFRNVGEVAHRTACAGAHELDVVG